ncbi:MAG TPA: hypothetical protein VG478_15510, partial [Acidimicrobiales bacterium]|nr:hypothetical protein [Acidimicrobiales bacterium]
MISTKSVRHGRPTKVIGPLFAIAAAAGLVSACGGHDELDTTAPAAEAAAAAGGLPVDYAVPDVRPGQRSVAGGLPVDYAVPDVRPGQRSVAGSLPVDYAVPDVRP